MTYEWEEEIPQPKPPTRRVGLMVKVPNEAGDRDDPVFGLRPATQADIARALGVSEAQLVNFLKHPVSHFSQQPWGLAKGYSEAAHPQWQFYPQGIAGRSNGGGQ